MLLLIFVSLIQCGEQTAQADIDSTQVCNFVNFQLGVEPVSYTHLEGGAVL